MPSEVRQIFFTLAELIDAVESFNRYNVQRFRDGNIVGFDIHNESEISITVTVLDKSTDSRQETTLDQAYILAAIVRRCMDSRIRLPRRAEKHLKVHGDSLALTFTLKSGATHKGIATKATQ